MKIHAYEEELRVKMEDGKIVEENTSMPDSIALPRVGQSLANSASFSILLCK